MDINESFMRRALQLAASGRGEVSPNPMVGAVIVDSHGKIIGEGYHRRYGGPHAEVNAINSVSDESLLRDSTIYVTLEPCSHYGKTPPCAKLLIDKGLPRVVVGALDPFPKVSGRGVAMLREAGIEVVTGVLDEECRAINRRFMTAHKNRRPYVQLKWAESADGYLDAARTAGSDAPRAISNRLSMLFMHRERAAVDAILVGAGTVAMDNPSLTVRGWNCRRQPLRVVLDARLSIPAQSKLLADGQPTVVYNSRGSKTAGAVEYVQLDTTDIGTLLADLYGRGITSLMVEGGACVLNQFIASGMWDEARIERGSCIFGGGVEAPAVKGIVTNEAQYGSNKVKTVRNSVKY